MTRSAGRSDNDKVWLLENAFDYSPNQQYIIDVQAMKFIKANQNALQFLGLTNEELRKTSLTDIHSYFTSENLSSFSKAFSSGRCERVVLPTIFRGKNSVAIDADLSLYAFHANDYWYIQASVVDVSEQKKEQKKHQLNTAILTSISDAIYTLDKNFSITSWNKYAEEIFGWEEKDVLGCACLNLIKPEHINSSYEEVVSSFFSNGYWKGEAIYTRKNGERFPASIAYTTLKENEG